MKRTKRKKGIRYLDFINSISGIFLLFIFIYEFYFNNELIFSRNLLAVLKILQYSNLLFINSIYTRKKKNTWVVNQLNILIKKKKNPIEILFKQLKIY